jgi:hypothetical protein
MKNGAGFYARTSVDGKHKFLHRLIMGAPKGVEVDHINGEGRDNRRSNLRLCTHAENGRNSVSRTGKSQYKGVYFDSRRGRWIARIRKDRKYHWLGSFHNEEDAARAYNLAAPKLHGEFARPNAIEEVAAYG